MTTLIETIIGDVGDTRRWRAYRARVAALPAGHRMTGAALDAVGRAEADDGRSSS